MTGFEIALGTVGRGGAYVSGQGADYDAALARLRERSNGGHNWEDDGLFGVIVGTYTECLQVSLEALAGIGGEITDTGEGLRLVTANTRATEDANIENLTDPAWL
ncbi:hypothetical protein MF672_023675 [Actinomadura sp. ATCC 31491]|uniref:Uncharacterized protein n=1 Tax=Actinomadura luzonensis TaxID=2805427 RepID=A0ABT0FWQ6_9ACTN|nr:hypothetical protein [Actinomadura luzonensis]MCK2216777.1 hypothetical protein [Actinomadura luzonensis]